jgi:hypothetical protein
MVVLLNVARANARRACAGGRFAADSVVGECAFAKETASRCQGIFSATTLGRRGLIRDRMTTNAFMQEMRGDPDRDPGFKPRPGRMCPAKWTPVRRKGHAPTQGSLGARADDPRWGGASA